MGGLMQFFFDKASCQNTRRALRHEWLLTNGLGDYAASSILCCNTRKYHGLFVKATPQGRCVLLSTIEESLCREDREFSISTRQHPMTIAPKGYNFQESYLQGAWPSFSYRMGNTTIARDILLVQNKSQLLMRWKIESQGILPSQLRLKPLLAFRSFHELTRANDQISTESQILKDGFAIRPYFSLPTIYFQTTSKFTYTPSPCWYYNVEYMMEHERGFPFTEDLFMPGIIDVAIPSVGVYYLIVGTEPMGKINPEELWRKETQATQALILNSPYDISAHLKNVAKQFIIKDQQNRPAILAGYHWFDSWGRDTLISLPGLTFYSGKVKEGVEILTQMAKAERNGLIPNMFGADGNDAYNSVDAALWFAFAVQCYWFDVDQKDIGWVKEYAWPALRNIIAGYLKGPGLDIYVDTENLLHAGNANTQLTWMDANAHGKPVTPRHGCAVELNALWYNTLEFYQRLANYFKEPVNERERLKAMRKNFVKRFYLENEGYLADCYRYDYTDKTVRPNQIFAVSLKYSMLNEEQQAKVVECVKNNLLTPFGLRTLAPEDPNFRSRYEGGPDERDASYHQGTVWPWLLGHYTDALLRVSWDVEQKAHTLLETILPLFTDHLLDAGVGTISEIFDAAPPYRPNGCVSQAWSVAEAIRLLTKIRKQAPGVFANFEQKVIQRLRKPTDDSAGRGKVL